MRKMHQIVAVALSLGVAGFAQANHVTLSGLFEGDEPSLPRYPESCTSGDPLAYVEAGPVRVSSTGLYHIVDAGNFVAVDVTIQVYEGSFDPGNTSRNRILGIDEGEQVELTANQDYVFVLQHWCENRTGAWGVAISGSGQITGTGVVESPEYTIGNFTSSDPTADFGFGPAPYDLAGPVRFDEEGTYFYADLSIFRRVDMELLVYEGPFDPQNFQQNLVARLDDAGSLDIRTGRDYFFVTAPLFSDERGEWHYTLFPPGRVEINRFLSGLWVDEREDPAAGDYAQGLFIEVFPSLEFVFGAWFTWDLADGAPSVEAIRDAAPEALGATDQRWITAFGTYETGDTSMDISFENTTGGVFNASSPNIDRDSAYGTGTIISNGCRELVVEFDLPDAPTSGSTTFNRVEDEFVQEFCSIFGARPGVIE